MAENDSRRRLVISSRRGLCRSEAIYGLALSNLRGFLRPFPPAVWYLYHNGNDGICVG